MKLNIYVQIDLYSQCTGCTGPAGTGSWWSSKGTNPNLYEQRGTIPANLVNDYLDQIGGKPCLTFCRSLAFLGSPNCDCILASEYGCQAGDQQ